MKIVAWSIAVPRRRWWHRLRRRRGGVWVRLVEPVEVADTATPREIPAELFIRAFNPDIGEITALPPIVAGDPVTEETFPWHSP